MQLITWQWFYGGRHSIKGVVNYRHVVSVSLLSSLPVCRRSSSGKRDTGGQANNKTGNNYRCFASTSATCHVEAVPAVAEA